MVPAVCNARGLGVLARARILSIKLREDIRAVKARTDRHFGVNFLPAPPEPGNEDVATAQRFLHRFREELDLPIGEIDLRPAALAARGATRDCLRRAGASVGPGLGDPTRLNEDVHAAGCRVVSIVKTVRRRHLRWRLSDRQQRRVFSPFCRSGAQDAKGRTGSGRDRRGAGGGGQDRAAAAARRTLQTVTRAPRATRFGYPQAVGSRHRFRLLFLVVSDPLF